MTKGSTSYTWTRGRLLSQYGGVSFQYDGEGFRRTKVNGTDTVTYYYQDGKLLSEKHSDTSKNLYFIHHGNEIVGFLTENVDLYYYQKDVLGNVIAIYNPEGEKVASYTYDAWGNCTIGTNVDGLADLNPIRYRGYYYDKETQLYYLQTRYYDPAMGRFISPDTVNYLDPETIHGLNLYAYCGNNPVMYVDPSGHFVLSTIGFILAGAAIGAITSAAASAVMQYVFEGEVDGKSVVVAAGTGFVSGALSASPLGVGALMVAGAIVEGASYLIDCYVTNEDFSVLGFGVAVASGIIFAKLGGNGANYQFNLSNAAKHMRKTIDREKRRANKKYAEKATKGAIKWLKDELFDQAAVAGISNYYGSQLGIATGNFFSWLEKEIRSFFDF